MGNNSKRTIYVQHTITYAMEKELKKQRMWGVICGMLMFYSISATMNSLGQFKRIKELEENKGE
jgi:hypothetical protein